jgi:AhpD family alkylhydroperoxidase
MAFLKYIPAEKASDDVKAMYDQAIEQHGFVPNMVKVFGHRPKVMKAWSELLATIRDEMDQRRYELITLAAARALRSSYCMLAHGSVLARDFLDAEQVAALAQSFHGAGLTPRDDAHGLSDVEIFDIAAAAAARCFLSKTVDALGAQPDRKYAELEDELRESLTIGRPIEAEDETES